MRPGLGLPGQCWLPPLGHGQWQQILNATTKLPPGDGLPVLPELCGNASGGGFLPKDWSLHACTRICAGESYQGAFDFFDTLA